MKRKMVYVLGPVRKKSPCFLLQNLLVKILEWLAGELVEFLYNNEDSQKRMYQTARAFTNTMLGF